MKQLKYIIYALQDPTTNELRYVGKSVNGLTRARAHCYPGSLERDKTYKGNWLRQLVNKGLKPNIKVVQQLNNISELNQAEQYWIEYFRNLGCPLTNSTNGGMGRCGLPHTEETKKKISFGQKNKKVYPKGEAHGMYGRKLTEEEKQTISKRTKEKMNNPDTKEKLLKRKNGSKFIDNHGNYYESIYDAHRKTGLSRDVIREILNNKRSEYKNYKFEYINKSSSKVYIDSKSHFTKKIIDQNGNVYNSLREAANKLNLSEGNISQVISGKYTHTKGYSFKEVT